MNLLILGALFLVGLVADVAGRLTPLPRVSLLIASGIVIGPAGFGFLSEAFVSDWFPTLTQIALTMIGFLLGQKLSTNELREEGSSALGLALGKVVGSAIMVFVALTLLGVDAVPALLFAGISTATDPAATLDVAHESGRKGPFVDMLLRIVAIDDAWGLIAFAVLAAFAATLSGDQSGAEMVSSALWETGGSIVLGALLGIPMSFLTGRLALTAKAGEPIQAEAFGFVLVCAGAAATLDMSPILAAMVMGAVVASVATHHDRPFAAIEGIEWPFMLLFFVLAGASFNLQAVGAIGVIALGYIVARGIGTYAGVYAIARAQGQDTLTRRWLGLALLPQAGVALGMALIASQRFPAYAETIISTTLLTTIVLELTSPMVTRYILEKQSAASDQSPDG